jgi:hypothetical protein
MIPLTGPTGMYRQAGRTGLSSLRGERCWGVTDTGAGSIKKLGGRARFRGALFERKGHLKNFPWKYTLATGGGVGGGGGALLKIFFGHVIIFSENKKILPEVS